jgi:hypothetical protein
MAPTSVTNGLSLLLNRAMNYLPLNHNAFNIVRSCSVDD